MRALKVAVGYVVLLAGCVATVDDAAKFDPVVKPVMPSVSLGRNNNRPFQLYRAALMPNPQRSDQNRMVLYGEPTANPCTGTGNFQVRLPLSSSYIIGRSNFSSVSTDWSAQFLETTASYNRSRFVPGGAIEIETFDGYRGRASVNVGATGAGDVIQGSFHFESCL